MSAFPALEHRVPGRNQKHELSVTTKQCNIVESLAELSITVLHSEKDPEIHSVPASGCLNLRVMFLVGYDGSRLSEPSNVQIHQIQESNHVIVHSTKQITGITQWINFQLQMH